MCGVLDNHRTLCCTAGCFPLQVLTTASGSQTMDASGRTMIMAASGRGASWQVGVQVDHTPLHITWETWDEHGWTDARQQQACHYCHKTDIDMLKQLSVAASRCSGLGFGGASSAAAVEPFCARDLDCFTVGRPTVVRIHRVLLNVGRQYCSGFTDLLPACCLFAAAEGVESAQAAENRIWQSNGPSWHNGNGGGWRNGNGNGWYGRKLAGTDGTWGLCSDSYRHDIHVTPIQTVPVRAHHSFATRPTNR